MFKAYFATLVCLVVWSAPLMAQTLRPVERPETPPAAAWDHKAEGLTWTRAALIALDHHGTGLVQVVPRDIGSWCPGYAVASARERSAFWVGLLSALAKHESTWQPKVVGSGRWYGLLQIQPSTARGYGCKAQSGAELKDGAQNIQCAIRIWAATVTRDQVIALGGKGIAADWGPMTRAAKRANMSDWTRSQTYCQLRRSRRPVMRNVLPVSR